VGLVIDATWWWWWRWKRRRIAMPLLFAPVVLASLVGVSVSFPFPTTASLFVITSLGPVDDGDVVDKEGGGSGPM
jgi:hypothetical protein